MNTSKPKTHSISAGLVCCAAFFMAVKTPLLAGVTIEVTPASVGGIQSAIDSAANGDTILVHPGTYHGGITLRNKSLTLASLFLQTDDPAYIGQTVLDGVPESGGSRAGSVVRVDSSAGLDTRIIGFTIQGGNDGITPYTAVDILHNRIWDNVDGIDYESGSGLCQYNTIEDNLDDAIDLDEGSAVLIADNRILNNHDDGIEIRLHAYSGPLLETTIRNNVISGNGEDGIQLIDYPDLSDRVLHIERNVIVDNAMAGIGCMANGNTVENYEAADIPEPVFLVNNTFLRNEYGVTGGDNLVAVNNIFSDTTQSALKEVDGDSITSYNLFWNNGTDNEGSTVDPDHFILEDPLLDGYQLLPESPGINAGTAEFVWDSQTLVTLPEDFYIGTAPDLGAIESAVVPEPLSAVLLLTAVVPVILRRRRRA